MTDLSARADVPASDHGPAAGRGIVRSLLPVWDRGELVDDAQLVVSELITNALKHTRGADTFRLEVARTPRGARITLSDGSAVRPLVAEVDHERPSGRGMRLVEAISASWGAEDNRDGKLVWVELERGGAAG